MKMLASGLLATTLLSISGCSNDYTPPEGASGEQIFQEVCAECHKADNKDVPGMIFALGPLHANPIYIAQTVHIGAVNMPKFPNIQGKAMRDLSDYVLIHNLSRDK